MANSARLLGLTSLALFACGRSSLDVPDERDGSSAPQGQDASEPGVFGDAGAAPDALAPPLPTEDAAPPPEAQCAEAPPLAAGCPAQEPHAGAAVCTPGTACAYATARGAETFVAIYTCGLVGEDATGWKESEVPCARACFADGGATPLDAGDCLTRETVPCAPSPGQSTQDLLDMQVLASDCVHHEGAGGFAVRFDSQGCAISMSGGAFTACDETWLTTRRFACALDHPCAVAPTLAK